MDQLNLNSNKVEEEFRKRVAEYKSSSHGGVNGGLAGTGVDSSSVSNSFCLVLKTLCAPLQIHKAPSVFPQKWG